MTFSAPIFLFCFFPTVLLLYFLIPPKLLRVRNALLTVASLIFYGFGEPFAMLLMLIVVGISWIFAGALSVQKKKGMRNLLLFLGIAGNLGILCVYKYADFLIESVNFLLHTAFQPLGLRLPIGISFFVFQAISYVIDVARKEAQPQKSYFRLLLYIAFFPQLIAGPIVRYQTVADALSSRQSTIEGVSAGLRKMIAGLSKKLLIADTVGLIADTVFPAAGTAGLPLAWLGAICYTLQIYYDFSGYSDMAIGMGEIFGFTFPKNFDYPYTSASVTEFWKRWHISLTTWFRQYVYIPLGGNRKGKFRTMLNKWIVFFCTGLWHGASWNFVIWGLMNGAMMTGEQAIAHGKPKRRAWYMHLYTMLFVILAFVIFRADTLSQAMDMYRAMVLPDGISAAALSACTQLLSPLVLTVLLCAVIGATPLPARFAAWLQKKCGSFGSVLTAAGAFAMLLLCMLNAAATTYHPFIYFRF